MSIILSDVYKNRVDTTDPNYPTGKPRNKVGEIEGTGTPYEEKYFQDISGAFQALLVEGEVTPSGNPDNVVLSDIRDAILKMIRKPLVLKIFQSPTDGLTEIQTRTLNPSEVYGVRKVSDDSLATIFSDKEGVNEIEQNDISNVSGSDGVVEFFVDDGAYYVEVDSIQSNFNVYKTSKLERVVEYSDSILEDAPIGTKYRIYDAPYEVVDGSDTGGFYLNYMAGKKLKLKLSGAAALSNVGVVNGGNLSAAINSLISANIKTISIDLESGIFEAAILDLTNCTMKGLGQTKSLFTRSFNSILFPNFTTGVELADLQITGGAAPLIECPTGSRDQKIDRCRLIPVGFPALTFDDQGGESIKCTSSIFGSGNTQIGGVALKAGVVMDTGGAQRHFTDCGGAGNQMIDLSGMNDTFITNGFSTNGLIFSDNTSKAFISNMRWGVSQTNPTTRLAIRGENITITNEVGLPLDLYCSSSRLATVTPDYDINDYGAGNMLSVRGRVYTPTFTGSGGVTPNIGNGSISGFYSREGNVVRVQIELVWGGTSTLGNGRFQFGTPINMPPVQSIFIQQYSGSGIVRSASSLMVSGRFFTNERYFELGGVDSASARIDVGVQTPLTAGDRIWFEGTFAC